jgi:hypothetical protein
MSHLHGRDEAFPFRPGIPCELQDKSSDFWQNSALHVWLSTSVTTSFLTQVEKNFIEKRKALSNLWLRFSFLSEPVQN